ncbi:MAG: hypothetical protein HYS06_02345 [Methylocystis sp.]|nr:hypothetical protein [Methylocystis sp.]
MELETEDPQDESTANVYFLQFNVHSTAIRNASDLRVGRAPNDRRRAFRPSSDRLLFDASARGFRASFVSFTARLVHDGDDDFFAMMLSVMRDLAWICAGSAMLNRRARLKQNWRLPVRFCLHIVFLPCRFRCGVTGPAFCFFFNAIARAVLI